MKALVPSAPRPERGHHAFRDQRRALMYRGANNALVELTVLDARALIKSHGSIRRAADAIGIPKSTLHDLAANTGKR